MRHPLPVLLVGFTLLPVLAGVPGSAAGASSWTGGGPGWRAFSFLRAGETITFTIDVERSGPAGVGIFTFDGQNTPTSPFHTLLFDDRNVNGDGTVVSFGLIVRVRRVADAEGDPIDRVIATFSARSGFVQQIVLVVGGDGADAWSIVVETNLPATLRGTTGGDGAFATTPRDWAPAAEERVDEDDEVLLGANHERTFSRPVTFVWDRLALGPSPAPMEILGPKGLISCRCVEFGTEHDAVSNAGTYRFHYGSVGHEADSWVVGAEGILLPG